MYIIFYVYIMAAILIWIFIIQLLDFYLKYNKLIIKKFKKTKQKLKKEDCFMIRKKWYWEKVIEDLEKEI